MQRVARVLSSHVIEDACTPTHTLTHTHTLSRCLLFSGEPLARGKVLDQLIPLRKLLIEAFDVQQKASSAEYKAFNLKSVLLPRF